MEDLHPEDSEKSPFHYYFRNKSLRGASKWVKEETEIDEDWYDFEGTGDFGTSLPLPALPHYGQHMDPDLFPDPPVRVGDIPTLSDSYDRLHEGRLDCWWFLRNIPNIKVLEPIE